MGIWSLCGTHLQREMNREKKNKKKRKIQIIKYYFLHAHSMRACTFSINRKNFKCWQYRIPHQTKNEQNLKSEKKKETKNENSTENCKYHIPSEW